MLVSPFCRSAFRRIPSYNKICLQSSSAWFTNANKSFTSLSSPLTGTTDSPKVQILNSNIKPKIKDIRATAVQTIRTASTGPTNRRPPDEQKNQMDDKEEFKEFKTKFDNTVKFKQKDFAEKVRQFYSLYGPLFVICHIAVSLTSIGFFYSIVYLTVDPMKYLPESLITMIGTQMRYVAGESSKFVLAYAIHKLILPFRLGGSIYLTQRLSKRVKFPWLNRSVKNDKN